jgi:hypothetical protein
MAHQLQALIFPPAQTFASTTGYSERDARQEPRPVRPVGCMRGLGSPHTYLTV